MNKGPFIVDVQSERPVGKPGECFYCKSALGSRHSDNCVIPERTIVMRVEMDVVVRVPSGWSEGSINFHRNESSWCCGNWRGDLLAMFAHFDSDKDGHGCGCGNIRSEYLREATEQDEIKLGEGVVNP